MTELEQQVEDAKRMLDGLRLMAIDFEKIEYPYDVLSLFDELRDLKAEIPTEWEPFELACFRKIKILEKPDEH